MRFRAIVCFTALCVLLAPVLAMDRGEDPAKVLPTEAKPFSLDTPHLTREFDTVLNFKLVTDGMRETVKDEEACRFKCLERESCRSYSWSETGTEDKPGKTCIWSAKFIGFDPDWEFYTRTYAIDVSGKLTMTGPFHGFPGMRFVEDRFHTELNDLTLEQCEERCEQDTKCRAYSFSAAKGECLLSDGGVTYAPGFSYNERNQPVPGKPGRFRYYPKTVTSSQKQEAKIHNAQETALAKAEKSKRSIVQAQQSQLASQMRAKKTEEEELQRQADEEKKERLNKHAVDQKRQSKLTEDMKTAEERGRYAESVVKSKINVNVAKTHLAKEKSMKKAAYKQRAAKAANDASKQEKEEANEMFLKKQISKMTTDIAKTDKVTARLQFEQAARLLQVEAFKLAQKERSMKGILTPAINRLISEELKYQKKSKVLSAALRSKKSKFQMWSREKAKQDQLHRKAVRDLRKEQAASIKLAKHENKQAIENTKLQILQAGPALKLKQLRIADAIERALYDKKSGFIDSLVGRDTILVVNNSYICGAKIGKETKKPGKDAEQELDNNDGAIVCESPSKPVSGLCKDANFPFKSTCAANICYSSKEYASCGPNPGTSSWCCTDDSCSASSGSVNKCQNTAREKADSGAVIKILQKLQHTFTLQDAGGYPFIAFKVLNDPKAEGPNQSGRMCETDGNKGGETFQCKAAVPAVMGGKLDRAMRFVLEMGAQGFGMKTTASGKSCRLSADMSIICDLHDLPADDPTTRFQIFAREPLIEDPAFVPYASKSICDEAGEFEPSNAESESDCKAKCCRTKGCAFVTFLDQKPKGKCHMFGTCESLTSRVKMPQKNTMFTTFQKTGLTQCV